MSSPSSFQLNHQLFNPTLYARIREIWFADCTAGATAPTFAAMQKWFGIGSPEQKAEFDGICRKNFEEALASIGPDKLSLPQFKSFEEDKRIVVEIAKPFIPETSLSAEKQAAEDTLSLVLLLDQIPRNMFRTHETLPLVFTHYDRLARALVSSILSQPPHLRADLAPQYRLAPAYRQWFYMPLMHSEDLADHEKYEEIVNELKKEVMEGGDEDAMKYMEKATGAANSHVEILRRFGRYPHRNEALGRETTQEEKEYLEGGGHTFGVQSKKEQAANATQAEGKSEL